MKCDKKKFFYNKLYDYTDFTDDKKHKPDTTNHNPDNHPDNHYPHTLFRQSLS
jgi:hypothetical protein